LGKPKIPKQPKQADMNDDNLAELNYLLKDPIRQKILLKLREYDRLSFGDLMEKLKLDNPQVLHSQLSTLGDLVTAVEDTFLLIEQGVSKRPGGQYMLIEKGVDAVNELVCFPEIKSEDYKEKIEQKFHSQQALRRRVLGGVVGGYGVSFFAAVFFTIFSIFLFHGPTFFLADGWPFYLTVFVFAPVVGGFVGYWMGEKKNFERPEPEWNYN
jgi:hypothetical protein